MERLHNNNRGSGNEQLQLQINSITKASQNIIKILDKHGYVIDKYNFAPNRNYSNLFCITVDVNNLGNIHLDFIPAKLEEAQAKNLELITPLLVTVSRLYLNSLNIKSTPYLNSPASMLTIQDSLAIQVHSNIAIGTAKAGNKLTLSAVNQIQANALNASISKLHATKQINIIQLDAMESVQACSQYLNISNGVSSGSLCFIAKDILANKIAARNAYIMAKQINAA